MGNIFNKDFLEFIDCLNKSQARYMLVGGYSVILHGYPRTTGDLDVWVDCSESNYVRLSRAFELFRLPLFDMTRDNFLNTEDFDVFRFGRPPVAIDIITVLKGMSFEEAWKRVENKAFESVDIKYINYDDLIDAKRASGRHRDIDDIENLESN